MPQSQSEPQSLGDTQLGKDTTIYILAGWNSGCVSWSARLQSEHSAGWGGRGNGARTPQNGGGPDAKGLVTEQTGRTESEHVAQNHFPHTY